MTDNDDLRERAKVEQIDRDAAAAYGANGVADHHFTSGAVDDHSLVLTLARHRLSAIEPLQQRVERLEVALRGLLSSYIGTCRFGGRVISEIEQHHCVIDARAALGDDVG